jgi:hypothetical protein
MKAVSSMFCLFPASAFAAETITLPPLAPAYGELPPTFWEQYQSVIIVTGFALLAVAFLVLRMVLRPKTPVVLPPEDEARLALAKLHGRPEDGKVLSEASQILRHYFCTAFALPAAEMTTAEFAALLAANDKIGAEFAQMISSFLGVCDKDKFSPKVIAPPLNAVARALELIETAERRRAASIPGTATPPTTAASAKQSTFNNSGGRTP